MPNFIALRDSAITVFARIRARLANNPHSGECGYGEGVPGMRAR
jgi:hypothetical protein